MLASEQVSGEAALLDGPHQSLCCGCRAAIIHISDVDIIQCCRRKCLASVISQGSTTWSPTSLLQRRLFSIAGPTTACASGTLIARAGGRSASLVPVSISGSSIGPRQELSSFRSVSFCLGLGFGRRSCLFIGLVVKGQSFELLLRSCLLLIASEVNLMICTDPSPCPSSQSEKMHLLSTIGFLLPAICQ